MTHAGALRERFANSNAPQGFISKQVTCRVYSQLKLISCVGLVVISARELLLNAIIVLGPAALVFYPISMEIGFRVAQMAESVKECPKGKSKETDTEREDREENTPGLLFLAGRKKRFRIQC